MRVKSVPRHLPRKDGGGIPGLSSRPKNAELYGAVDRRGEEKYSALPYVKTVNFTNYQDMLQEMNLVVRQQIPVPSSVSAFEKWRPIGNVEQFQTQPNFAVDLSMKATTKNFSPAIVYDHNNNNNNNSSSRRSSSTSTCTVSSGSYNNNSGSNGNDFKGTYLYQIMTDPQLLSKIESRSREKQQQQQHLVPPPVVALPKPSAPAPMPTPTPPPTTRVTRQSANNNNNNNNRNNSNSNSSNNNGNLCPYCKRDFGSESEVKRHLNVQANGSNNQLSCCACGKQFAQKRYLRYHQRCHSERNKFACELCTRKYSRLDNLTRHNIFHTNPDKFPCTYCERTFARKDLLNKHLKCHENKYKYHCDVCKKYFKGPVSLDNHLKTYHHRLDDDATGSVEFDVNNNVNVGGRNAKNK